MFAARLSRILAQPGKLLGFNVDPNFSETLDGLILVDLRQTDPSMLRRYMGPERAARFLEYHQPGIIAHAGD